ncbi:hypothetical protein HY480_03955 [Candidatus Uhrbacteria bacterium]|nr:hypothetical protein [Candidatus Uhrbacteria bacterium]
MTIAAVPNRAVAVRDRPQRFLAQVIDAGLAAGALDAVDVDELESDFVNLVFRYLEHMDRDLRDLAAVRDAAAIVLCYVEDGLRLLSQRGLEDAVRMLRAQSVSEIFRAGFGTMERLRQDVRALESVEGNAIRIGPPGCELRMAVFPRVHRLDPRLGDDFQVMDLIRDGEATLAGIRKRMRDHLTTWRARLVAFRALPLDDIATRWSSLLTADFESAGNESGVFSRAWWGACIRAYVRGDLGVVVSLADTRAFASALARGDADVESRVTERLSDLLAPRCDAETLAVIPSIVAVVIDAVQGARTAPESPMIDVADPTSWATAWAEDVFLAVTPAERARITADDIDRASDTEELLLRLPDTSSRDDRRRILDALHLDRASADDVVASIAAAPDCMDEIIARAALDARSVKDLDVLAQLDLGGGVATDRLRAAIVQRAPHLRGMSHDAILDLANGISRWPELLPVLIAKWGAPLRDVVRAFREESDPDGQDWWVLVASASPRHFAELVAEVRSRKNEAARIITCVGVVGSEPLWLHPPHVAACVLHLETVTQRRKRRSHDPFASDPDAPTFMDNDARWLWSHLAPTHRDAVRAAFIERLATPAPAPRPARSPSNKRRKSTRVR